MTINRFKKTTVSVLVALSLGATGAIANDQISKPAGAKGTGTAKAFQAKNNQFWFKSDFPPYGVNHLIQPHPPSEGGGQVGFALHRAEFFEFSRENRYGTYLDLPWA